MTRIREEEEEAIKYSFSQADEILRKINAFQQYYLSKQELVYCMRDTVT